MPLPVTPWAMDTFPGAKSLNLAMYTADGTLDNPQGVLFHARRPMQLEVLDDIVTFPGSSGGQRTSVLTLETDHYDATQIVDNAGYYGQTSDGSYPFCQYRLVPVVKGSAGDGITPGGVTLICHFLPLAGAGTSFQAAGAELWNGASTFVCAGTRQEACQGGIDTICFFLDLQDTAGTEFGPGAFITDSAGNTASTVVNTTDSSGETPRFWTLWAGAGAAQQASYGTPAAPAPTSSFTASTTIGTSSALDVDLNGANGIKGPLDFLSNPPLLRVQSVAGTSIPDSTATQVPLGSTAALDPYSGWSTPAYTVPRDGLYLAHGVAFYSSSGTGNRCAGINVNGTTYWGPGYPGTSSALTGCTKTHILDLAAGDTVSLYTEQTSGGGLTLATSEQTRLILTWLGARTAPAQTWTPPALGFSWQAGSGELPPLWQQYVGNDLGFLINRPFLAAYQTTAQTGFANGAIEIAEMDTLGGLVHGSPGDPYGGWTAGTSNTYTAVAAGWYLAVMEVFASFPSATTSPALTAGFSVTTSGGRTPQAGFDRYQQILPPASGYAAGATAAGLYYLLPGESITPQVQAQDWTSGSGTWGTSVTGVNSHLELVWVSE